MQYNNNENKKKNQLEKWLTLTVKKVRFSSPRIEKGGNCMRWIRKPSDGEMMNWGSRNPKLKKEGVK
jgi:hypothetical protein